MLKITHLAEDNETVTLKLEGRIMGPWVNELRKEAELWLADGSQIVLDLSGVSFVDDEGSKTLKAIMNDGVQLRGCCMFLACLLNPGHGADENRRSATRADVANVTRNVAVAMGRAS